MKKKCIKNFFAEIDSVIRDYYISSDELKERAENLSNLINERHDMTDGFMMGYLSALADVTNYFDIQMFKREKEEQRRWK